MFRHVKIEVGIPKTPGDSDSNEDGILASIDLTSGGYGLALEPATGWIPKVAQSKGGLWSENELVSGRVLQTIADQNVTEEMSCFVHSGTVEGLGMVMVDLRRIVQLLHDFWQTSYQIAPVYLNVWFLGAPGPQYALLYSIDISESLDVSHEQQRDVNLTLEREPYWRPLPPGSNPRLWTLYKKVRTLGIEATTAELDLTDVTNSLIYDENTDNRIEWNSADYDTFLSNNWLDISSADIDGDAPALASIGFREESQSSVSGQYTFGIAENPQEFNTRLALSNRTSQLYRGFNSFNAGDANTVSSFTKTINTCGVISNGQNTNKYTANYAAMPNGATDGPAWSGWSGTAGTGIPFTLNQFLGSWIVLLRAGVDNGADNQVEVHIEFKYGLITVNTPTVTMPVTSDANCWTAFSLLYMGIIDIIPDTISQQSNDGLGAWVDDADDTPTAGVIITCKFDNTNASTRDVRVCDLILIPVHRLTGTIDITAGFNVIFGITDRSYIIDNSGYYSHGKLGTIAKNNLDVSEYRGKDVEIMPGVNSRLYFLGGFFDSGVTGAFTSDPNQSVKVGIDIIPRWRSVRDV